MKANIKDENFIIFGEDFGRHPHSLEHLLRPLFDNNRFLWVETIGLRSPKFSVYDFKRSLEKLGAWVGISKRKGIHYLPANVILIKPFMIPFNQFSLVRSFNRWNVLRKVNSEIIKRKILHPISISSVPNACDFIGEFHELFKIYYCVDEFSLWPGLNLSLVRKLEDKLIEKVDLIIATSDSLSQSKRILGKTTPIITHGVEFNHFNIQAPATFNSPLKLCYFGLFDERSDQGLLLHLMKQITNCELHIFGDVVCDVKKLKALSNVKFHGKIAYQKLPSTIKTMDIFLLPYRRNKLTDNINPLKLKEYLSTGKPVISTDLPEVKKLKDYLFVAHNTQDFIDTIKNLRSKNISFDSQKTLRYIEDNETWNAKAKLLSEILLMRLPANRSSPFLS